MNTNTEDLSAGGIFVHAYSSAARTDYRIKIPTDTELANYVNDTRNTTQSSYDNRSPESINYLLSTYVSTSPLTTSTI